MQISIGSKIQKQCEMVFLAHELLLWEMQSRGRYIRFTVILTSSGSLQALRFPDFSLNYNGNEFEYVITQRQRYTLLSEDYENIQNSIFKLQLYANYMILLKSRFLLKDPEKRDCGSAYLIIYWLIPMPQSKVFALGVKYICSVQENDGSYTYSFSLPIRLDNF